MRKLLPHFRKKKGNQGSPGNNAPQQSETTAGGNTPRIEVNHETTSEPSNGNPRPESGPQNGSDTHAAAAAAGADAANAGRVDHNTAIVNPLVSHGVAEVDIAQTDGQAALTAGGDQPAPQDTGAVTPNVDSADGGDAGAAVSVDYDSLWDEAYDALKAGKTKSLVERYEKVVSKEIAKSNKQKAKAKQKGLADTAETEQAIPEQVSQDDRELRRKQMNSLVHARQDTSEAGSTVKDIAEGAEKVVSALKDKIASALEAYPPAGLAFAGLSLLLDTAVVSIKASKANIKGLKYVVLRLTWYGTLTRQLLRDHWKTDTKQDFAKIRDNIKDRLLDLFKELIKYEMKSVCSYYGWNRAATYLGDQADLNDWKGDVDEIKASQEELFNDVAIYNNQLSLDLQGQQVQSSDEMKGLMEQLVKLQADHELREKRREERELKHEDEATKKQINELIQAFSVKGLYYNAFKDNLNKPADDGTCIWFRTHDSYEDWLKSSCGLMLVSAPPGCGKSVLMRTLVDESMAKRQDGRIICHFFFKDSNLQNQPEYALCAVLHQLFKERRRLVLDFKDVILDEEKEVLQGDRDKLWGIFVDAIAKIDDEDVVCFLDALDECQEAGREWLVAKLADFLENRQPQHLKFLVTSRPYENILQLFGPFQTHFIELETKDKEITQISKEIDTVIDRKLNILAGRRRKPPSPAVVASLRKALKATENRTYLWVRLVFDVLEKIWLDSEDDWMKPVQHLPASVDEAYEKLLEGVPAEYKRAVHQMLSIMLAALRPLSVEELRLSYISYLGLEPLGHSLPNSSGGVFAEWLTNTCGFLVHIFEGKVLFIHQTVREFLTCPKWASEEPDMVAWKQSVSLPLAHRILTEAIIAYLSHADLFSINFVKTRYPFPRPDYRAAGFSIDSLKVMKTYFNRFKFLQYASRYWVAHFELAQTYHVENDLEEGTFYDPKRLAEFESLLQDVRPRLRPQYLALFHKPNFCTLVWWQLSYGGNAGWPFPASLGWGPTNDFIMGAECRHYRLLLKGAAEGQDLAARDQDRRTALHIACEGDHFLVARWLLFFGASLKEFHKSETGLPIQRCRSIPMVRTLILAGGDINEADLNGDTALHVASRMPKFNCQVASILIGAGANVAAINKESKTPLHNCEDPTLIRDLVAAGAPLDAQDAHGDTALHIACREGRDGGVVVKQLIELGASVHKQNDESQTPLHLNRRVDVARLLLGKGAERGVPDAIGRNPLQAILCGLTGTRTDKAELNPLIELLADFPVEEDFSRILRLFPPYPLSYFPLVDLVDLLSGIVKERGYPIRITRSDLLRAPLSRDFRSVFSDPLYEYIDWCETDPSLLDGSGRSLLHAACDKDLITQTARQYPRDLPHVLEKFLAHGFDHSQKNAKGLSVLACLLTVPSAYLTKAVSVARQLTAGVKDSSRLAIEGKPPVLFLLRVQLSLKSLDNRDLQEARQVFELMLDPVFPGGIGVDDEGQNALHYLAEFIARVARNSGS